MSRCSATGLWRRRYHADPGAIGRSITVSDEAYTIVGVMPPDFEFRYSEAELWTPLAADADLALASGGGAACGPGSRWRRPGARWKSWRTRWNRKRRKIAPALKIVVTPWSEMPEREIPADADLRAGRRRAGDVDRLRRCGRPAAEPRGTAAEGDRDSRFAGRRVMAGRAAVAVPRAWCWR